MCATAHGYYTLKNDVLELSKLAPRSARPVLRCLKLAEASGPYIERLWISLNNSICGAFSCAPEAAAWYFKLQILIVSSILLFFEVNLICLPLDCRTSTTKCFGTDQEQFCLSKKILLS